ncbi:MAG: hypothetical protein AAF719_06455 [Pseudomonadota bacterium]
MSFGYRTPKETAALKAEAERRVRAGRSRAYVGRELGVPSSKLAICALSLSYDSGGLSS